MAWQAMRLAKPPSIHSVQIVVFAEREGGLFGPQVGVAGQLGVGEPGVLDGEGEVRL